MAQMSEKEKILQRIEYAQRLRGCTLNITLSAAMDYIRNAGKYDFFINDFTGNQSALYIRLYNKNGCFFDNKLWGFYNDLEILNIFKNIIENEC